MSMNLFLRMKCCVVLLGMLFLQPLNAVAQKSDASEKEMREKAALAFEAKKYDEAAPLFSQLLSLNLRDTLLNYYYGASLSMLPKDRRTSVSYLEFAVSGRSVPKEVWYFYGRGLMAAGRYSNAKEAFDTFLSSGAGDKPMKSEAKVLSSNCANADVLSRERKVIAVLGERPVPKQNFYSSYTFSEGNGKTVPAAEMFLSSADKEKLTSPVMFIASDLQTIYLGSLGKRSGTGKDLYRVRKQSNGSWSEPEYAGSAISSPEFEDFPFMERSGRTLYFSSKGFNSIGGYDVFRSDYDYTLGQWSAPVNMGLPINSTEDDMLFVPAVDGKSATYVTADNADPGQLILKTIELSQGDQSLTTIKGFYKSVDQQMRRDARISVIRQRDRAVVMSSRTDPRTGQYELVIPADEDYFLIVEGGGYVPHAERFSIPAGTDLTSIKQVVVMNRAGSDEQLQITNYFTSLDKMDVSGEQAAAEVLTSSLPASAVDSSQLIAVQIENSTFYVVDPNATRPAVAQNSPDAADKADDIAEATVEKLVIAEEVEEELDLVAEATEPVNGDITDDQLAQLALEDAADNRLEAQELRTDAADLKKQAEEKQQTAMMLAEEVKLMDSADTERKKVLAARAYELAESAAVTFAQSAQLDSMATDREELAAMSEKEAARLLSKSDTKQATAGRSESTPKSTTIRLQEPTAIAAPVVSSPTIRGADAEVTTEKSSPTETGGLDKLIAASTEPDKSSEAEDETEKDAAASMAEPVTTTKADLTANEPVAEVVAPPTPVKSQPEVVVLANEPAAEIVAPASPVTTPTESQPETVVVANELITEVVAPASPVTMPVESQPEVVVLANEPAAEVVAPASPVTAPSESQPEAVVVPNEQAAAVTAVREADRTSSVESISENESVADRQVEAVSVPKLQSETSSSEKTTSDSTAEITETAELAVAPMEVENTAIIQATAEIALNSETNADAKGDKVVAVNAEPVTTEANTELPVIDTENPVVNDPAAAVTYYTAYTNSKERSVALDRQFKELQLRIETMPVGEERDSIIAISGDISGESIRQWQLSQQQLKAARTADPDVEVKIGVVSTASSDNSLPDADITETSDAIIVDGVTYPVALEVPVTSPVQEEPTAATSVESAASLSSAASTTEASTDTRSSVIPEISQVSPVQKRTETTAAVDPVSVDGEQQVAVQPAEEVASEFSENQQATVPAETQVSISEEQPVREQVAAAVSETVPTVITAADLATDAPVVGDDVNATVPSNETQVAVNPVTTEVSDVQEPLTVLPAEIPGQQPMETSRSEEVPSSKVGIAEDVTVITENIALNTESEKQEAAVSQEQAAETAVPVMPAAAEAKESLPPFKDPEQAKVYTELKQKVAEEEQNTVDLFWEAVQLNKLAAEERAKAQQFTEAAAAETDTERKASLLDSAEEYTQQAIESENTARTKFADSRSLTEDIDAMNEQADALLVVEEQPIADNDQRVQSLSDSSVSVEHVQAAEIITAAETPTTTPSTISPTPVTTTPLTGEGVLITATPTPTDGAPSISPVLPSISLSTAAPMAYSATRKIPFDETLPDGLVFKVQIGAFKQPVNDDAFGGLRPVTAETTRPGWIRYCVGLFRNFDPANLVKKEMQAIGYQDAFVVAYLNGKRISLGEANSYLARQNDLRKAELNAVANTELNTLQQLAITPERYPSGTDKDEADFRNIPQTLSAPATVIKGTSTPQKYAVQVGVYRTSVTPQILLTIPELQYIALDKGLFKFTSGVFTTYELATLRKQLAVSAGVKDAFIIPYRSGVPVVSAEATQVEAVVETTPAQIDVPTEASSPVTETIPATLPAISNARISYSVQLGAFRENVPLSAVDAFIRISEMGIRRVADERGLQVFYAGDFSDYETAAAAKAVVVEKGAKDAFVVAFQGNKRISLSEARQLQGR